MLKLVQRQSNTQLPPITVSIGVPELEMNMTWSTLVNIPEASPSANAELTS
jgi:hypothetical protein